MWNKQVIANYKNRVRKKSLVWFWSCDFYDSHWHCPVYQRTKIKIMLKALGSVPSAAWNRACWRQLVAMAQRQKCQKFRIILSCKLSLKPGWEKDRHINTHVYAHSMEIISPVCAISNFRNLAKENHLLVKESQTEMILPSPQGFFIECPSVLSYKPRLFITEMKKIWVTKGLHHCWYSSCNYTEH